MKKDKDKRYVKIWETRCWKCSLLKRNFYGEGWGCPQNPELDETLEEDFGIKCGLFKAKNTYVFMG